jgi:hypothetical protein
MDKIANKLGYQPKDPELADLFKKYEELQKELHRLAQEIDAHPEFTRPRGSPGVEQDPETRPVPPGTGPRTGPQRSGPSGPNTGADPDPGMDFDMGSPPRSPQN